MKSFWGKLVSESSEISSKRFITLIGLLMLCIGFIANLFWDLKVDDGLYNSIESIVEIGMGTIVAEKFSKRISRTSNNAKKEEKDEVDLKL